MPTPKVKELKVKVTADPVELALNDNAVPPPTGPASEEVLAALGMADNPKVVALRKEIADLEAAIKVKKQELKAAEKGKKPFVSGVSLYEAAIAILAVEKRPMTCKEIVCLADERGLWSSPTGLTPDATLYSRLLADMNGKSPKVCRPEPGKFALVS